MSPIRFIPLAGFLLALGAQGQVLAQAAGPLAHRTAPTATSRSEASAEDAFFQKYPDALLYKGLFLFESGWHIEAAQVWERYLTVAPAGTDTAAIILVIEEAYGREFPEWLIYRGLGLAEVGDYRGAERVWTRYLELAPEDGDRESVRRAIAEVRGKQSPTGS